MSNSGIGVLAERNPEAMTDPLGEITSDYLTQIFSGILTIDSTSETRTVDEAIEEARQFMQSSMVQEIMGSVDALALMYRDFCNNHGHTIESSDIAGSRKGDVDNLNDEHDDDGHGHEKTFSRQRMVSMRGGMGHNSGNRKAAEYLSLSTLILKYLFPKKG